MNWLRDKVLKWLRIEYHTGEISNLHAKIRAYANKLSELEAANKPVEPTKSKKPECKCCGYDEHPGYPCWEYYE